MPFGKLQSTADVMAVADRFEGHLTREVRFGSSRAEGIGQPDETLLTI
jgi:hypothetical protein